MIARRHWLYLASAGVAGLVIGAAWPPPPLHKLKEQGNEWSLPTTADIARHVPQDMSAVTSGLRWKGETGGEGGDWRLAGVVHDPGPAILLMPSTSAAGPRPRAAARRGDRPPATDSAGSDATRPDVMRIAVGDALPDGSVLQLVDGDKAVTKRDACITTYQLFQTQPIDTSAGCKEPEAPDRGTPP